MARSTPSRRSKNLFGFGKRKPARKKVAAKRRGLFGFLTEQKVTYRRDVAAERKEREQDRKASLAMLKRAAADRARSDRERKREADRRDAAELRRLQIAEKKRKAERKASDDADRKIEREMRDKGYRNPSIRRTKKAGKRTAIDSVMETMSERYGYPESKQLRKVAQRIQRDNPNQASPEYRLGYNLGQVDRNTAVLRKTPGELHATFASLFGTIPSADWQSFEQAYKAGYGGQVGTDAPNPRRGNPEPSGDESEEYLQAKKIAELFHGRPVKEEIEIREEIRSHDWYAELGPLVELRVKGFRGYPFRTAKFKFGRKGDEQVLMLTSPDGRQFYLRGGDQEINLEALGMEKGTEWYRHFMTLGEVTYFSYLDGKKFHGFKMTEYTHKVGSALDSSGMRHIQKTNAKPVMIYDTLSGKISFSGGQGKVETDMLVDGMSPGIVN